MLLRKQEPRVAKDWINPGFLLSQEHSVLKPPNSDGGTAVGLGDKLDACVSRRINVEMIRLFLAFVLALVAAPAVADPAAGLQPPK